MAYDPVKQKAYNAQYYKKNKEAISEKHEEYRKTNKEAIYKQQAQRRKDLKENITYIATVGSDFYFGHTTQGLGERKAGHFSHLRAGIGSPGLQKRFDDLGEEAFKKIFDIQILGTFETAEEAMAEEAYLLSKYVGTSGCLNIQLH